MLGYKLQVRQLCLHWEVNRVCDETCFQLLKLDLQRLSLCSTDKPTPLPSFSCGPAEQRLLCASGRSESLSWFREDCGHEYIGEKPEGWSCGSDILSPGPAWPQVWAGIEAPSLLQCDVTPTVGDSSRYLCCGGGMGVFPACSIWGMHFFNVFIIGFRKKDCVTDRLRQKKVYRSV